MGQIGAGYGSEWHLLRYMGRHRRSWDEMVLKHVRADSVEWFDFNFNRTAPCFDAELRDLEFILPADLPLHAGWREFWPRTGEPPNWDVVGLLRFPYDTDYLLVEAKANLEELCSDCQAKEEGGRPRIREAFKVVKQALGVAEDRDWLTRYYQLANRLAVLHFLNSYGVGARLLLVYFTGDRTPGKICPATQQEWQEALRVQDQHIGLPLVHPLVGRVHKLFVPVC